MPEVQKPGGLLSSALYLAKQGLAGAMLPFMESEANAKPTNKGKTLADAFDTAVVHPYAPVAGELIPSSLYELTKLAAHTMGYEGPKSKALDKMSANVNSADDLTNTTLGINDPSNTAETAARVLGGMALGGKTPNFRSAVKATTAAGKVANAVKGTGKVAAELAIPFRQGGIKTVLGATALGTGLAEAADTLDNQSNYTSIKDLVNPKGVVRPELREKPISEYMTPETAAIWNEGDEETQQQIMAAVYLAQQEDKKQSYVPDTPMWEKPEIKEAAVLATAGLAAFLGARTLAKTKQRLTGSTSLAGQSAVPHFSDATTQATQGIVQNDQSVRNATAAVTGDKGKWFGVSKGLQEWNAKFDSVTAPSLNSKIDHFLITGELPGSSTTTKPLGIVVEAIQKGLQPAERDVLTDGLLAGTALDDIKNNNGVHSSFKFDREGNPLTVQDLHDKHMLLQSDPKLQPIADEIKQSYRQQLDYLLEHGWIGKDQYDGFTSSRPNYVHISKNEAVDTSRSLWSRGNQGSVAHDRRINALGSRSENEGGGVKAGAAADPIIELPNQWASIIREVEIGRVKKRWLEFAAQSPELKDWVKQLPIGKTPEGNPKQIHTVFDNGMAHDYFIKDPAMAEALNFTPFAQQSAASTMLSTFKKGFEFGTTGPGNPFFAPVSMTYDTLAGLALRPKGYNLGVVNEALSKINPKLGIGGLDPTAWVSAPIGAIRHAWDSVVQSVSQDLAVQLATQKGLVFDSLGPATTDALQTRLANIYSATIKSQMDASGASNSSIFSSSRPDRAAPGMTGIAPDFATGVAERALRDVQNGDLEGAQKVVHTVLAGSHYAFEATRANALARMYTGVLRSMHEGFRYQAFATNLPKVVTEKDLELLASQTRRIAADIGQNGAAELIQTATKHAAYANAGVQSLAQFGRMFHAQPVTFSMNLLSTLTGLLVLYYGPALVSKENRDRLRERTEEQRAVGFNSFGGLPVKVIPELRPIWGTLTAVLDDASGLNSVNPDGSDNFNPNFAKAIETLLDGDLTEQGQVTLDQNIKNGAYGAMPLTWGSFPAVNAIAAATTGLDVSFSRYTGQPQVIKPQKIDPLAGEGKFTDDAISASWQKAIEDVTGTMSFSYIRAGLDAQRALKDGNVTPEEAFKVAASRITDAAANQVSPSQNIIFGKYEQMLSPSTGEMKLFNLKKQGLKAAIAISNQDILTPFVDGKDPRSASMSLLDPLDLQNNQALIGTSLVPIGAIAAITEKSTRPIQIQIDNLMTQIDDVKNQKATTIEERNKQVNDLNEERLRYVQMMNNIIRQSEDAVSEQIGQTFTYQEFGKDPKKYEKLPWPPQPQPEPVQ